MAQQTQNISLDHEITLTPDFINIVAGNPNVSFSVGTLIAASEGRIGWFDGCITRLYYQDNGDDLRLVEISGAHPGFITATNLNDFRERLAEAACCGHRVTFCVTSDNKMVMLNVYPCDCKCEERNQPPIIT